MGIMLQDLRFGIRMLAKKPGFTLIAVVTLALGIGATTAIFTVVNAVLLRPLPYPDSDRLLSIGQQFKSGLAGAGEPKFLFWREQSQSFEAMAAYSNFGGAGGNLSGGSEPEYVRGLRVSEDFFRVLGVYPALGRAFTKEEDAPGAAQVVILSDGLWRRRFGQNTELIGSTVLLNDRPVTVVGVLPREFRFDADLFVPMQARPTANYDPNATVIGRLKTGVTARQARTELETIAESYRAAFPRQMSDGESIGVQPYQEVFTSDVSRLLWILFAAVGFLLLIACANVANLQLTRSAARQKEIAVRLALGASGWRVMRQLLTEGVLLAVVGGAAGLMLAIWGSNLLLAAVPQDLLPRVVAINIDRRVMAFALLAAVGTGLLFGLAPAWQSRNVDVNATLKEQAGRGGSARGKLRSALVVVEVALSLVLLVGAGLLARTFANLLGVEPGFDPHGVLTCQIELNGERYDTTAEASAFYRDALERISSIPGVEAAAVVNKLPLDWQFNMPVVFPDDPDKLQSVQFRMITPDYFNAMKIVLKQGRVFTEADNAAGAPVAIINEAFARRFFDGKDPLTRQLSVGRGTNDPVRQVVGVVSDTKQLGLDRPALPTVFEPIPQMPDKLMAIVRAFTAAHFTVRASVSPLVLSEAIKREIAGLDPTLPLSEIRSMDEIAGQSVASQRFNMLLLGLFAGLGLLLAAVGIYGVAAYVVELRTSEIGLRIALGARNADVLRLVLRHGLALVSVGVAVGLLASFALTRLMKSLLFGVSAIDPLTFAVVSLVLAGVALGACFVPARRATRVDPMVALRSE
ncbi:MAG TPA: ABC transporter permease [Blastocatellia bacterium]|nr:ABC transporter permease [Blastocatellia bacterium]